MVLLLVAGGVFFLDLATKAWVSSSLELGESVPVVDGVFHLTRVHNPGSAFGLLPSAGPFAIGLSFLALGLFLYLGFTWGGQRTVARLTLGLLAGGVAGNLVDRIRWGYVVDFLDFHIWPVFNVADSALTVGAIVLAVLVWREGFG